MDGKMFQKNESYPTAPPSPSLRLPYLSKGVLSSKCSLEIFWARINTALCIMKDFLLSLLNLYRLRKYLLPIYKFVLREKSFPLFFTHFCLELFIVLDDAQ